MRRAVAAGVGPRTGLTPVSPSYSDQRQRVDVGRLAHLKSFALLRGHVGERAEGLAGARERLVAREARTAEVGQLGRRLMGVGIVRHEHVLGLDVAVDHPAGVGVGERVGEGDADLQQLLVREGVPRHQLREGLTIDELGDEIEGVVVDVGLVQRHDRRMGQTRRRERLAGSALAGLRRCVVPVGDRHLRGQRYPLERDLAVQQLVIRPPDNAEPARAEALDQAIAAVQQRTLMRGPARVLGRMRRGASRGARASERRGLREPLRIGGLGRGSAPREMVLDEGLQRVHRVARSPSAGALPARERRIMRSDREVAGSQALRRAVILVPSV